MSLQQKRAYNKKDFLSHDDDFMTGKSRSATSTLDPSTTSVSRVALARRVTGKSTTMEVIDVFALEFKT